MSSEMCPECLSNKMSENDRKVFGCCSECSRYLERSWAHLDREYDRRRPD